MAGCGGQRGHVEQHQAVSSAGGHEDWGILARELRPSAHSPSLIRLSWCLLAPYINSLPIATLLLVSVQLGRVVEEAVCGAKRLNRNLSTRTSCVRGGIGRHLGS